MCIAPLEDIDANQVAAMPSVDPDETRVIVPVQPVHPELGAGNHITKDYSDYYGTKDMYMRLLEVPLSGGEATSGL